MLPTTFQRSVHTRCTVCVEKYCMCGKNKTLPFKTLFFDVLTYPVGIKIHIGFKNDPQTERQYSEKSTFFVI